MARIFQDSAGTIPVTTYDQPVGKIVRGAGTVDLVQSVSASRLTMARWPRGGRRNLLTWTEDFRQWNVRETVNITYPSGAPEGEVVRIALDTSTPVNGFWAGIERPRILPDSNGLMNGAVDLKSDGARYAKVMLAYQATSANLHLDLLTGDVLNTPVEGSWTVIGAEVTPISNGWWRVSLSAQTSRPNSELRICSSTTPPNNSHIPTLTGDGIAGILARFPQGESGPEPTSYQRVTTANDVTEEGVESLWHLYNDGGDSLQTDGPVPAGTYGYAYVDPYGEITFDTRVSDGTNPVQVADAPGRYLDLILRKGDFSTGEKENITSYWERRYK